MTTRNTALVFDSRWEQVTLWISSWVNPVLRECNRYGTKTFLLEGSEVVRENVEPAIQDYTPTINIFLGHGEIDMLGGFENNPVLDLKNVGIAKDSVIYAFSCLTGAKLGPRAIEKGVTVYIGYDLPFLFWINEAARSPLTDEFAKPCMLAGVQPIKSLVVEGKTAREAYQDTLNFLDDEIDYWKGSVSPEATFQVSVLIHNRDALVMLGDESATVSDPVLVQVITPAAVIGAGIGLGAIAVMLSKKNG